MNKQNALNWRLIVPVLGVLLILFGIGIFYDLDVSKAICNEDSLFATIMANSEFMIVSFLLTFIGTALFKYSIKKQYSILIRIILIIVALGCVGFSCWYVHNCLIGYEFNNFDRFFKNTNLWCYIITFVFEVGTGLFAAFFVNADKSLVLRFSLVVMFAIFVPTIIVNLGVKQLWGRPRFRMLNDSADYLQYFRSVYQPAFIVGRAEEIPALASYASIADDFKSFPSGHSTSAASAILLFYIPSLNIKSNEFKFNKYLCFGIGLLWCFLMMLSRIIMGAHFITDVTTGSMLTILLCWIGSAIFIKKEKSK